MSYISTIKDEKIFSDITMVERNQLLYNLTSQIIDFLFNAHILSCVEQNVPRAAKFTDKFLAKHFPLTLFQQ